MTTALALQLTLAGLSVGSVYALVALAIVLPFKASGVLNFGQGEVVTLGAYVALVLTQSGLPYAAVILGVLGVGLLGGWAIEYFFIRPIIRAPEFTIVIATFAIGLLIKAAISLKFGDSPNSVDGPFGMEPLLLGPVRANPTSLWIIGCTAAVTLGIVAFFKWSRLGKAMRAVSIDAQAAQLMGIRSESVYRLAWMMSTAIGAMAGLLVAPLVGVNPELGGLILRGLLAAVLGGFTSVGGALLGGLCVGLVETFSGVWLGSTFKNLMPFVVLMVVLVFRPQGFFGVGEVKRV
ncbi:MAG: hypothetical protein RI949_2818 [Pseudomonadota bacterium]